MTKTRRKLAGNTTTTDSRSQRNRADRRGSQLTIRALSPVRRKGARDKHLPIHNMVEQDHRGVKSRIKPMLGFKVFDSVPAEGSREMKVRLRTK